MEAYTPSEKGKDWGFGTSKLRKAIHRKKKKKKMFDV